MTGKYFEPKFLDRHIGFETVANHTRGIQVFRIIVESMRIDMIDLHLSLSYGLPTVGTMAAIFYPNPISFE